MTGELLTLTVGWICWCLLHSLLIVPRVNSWLQERMGESRFYYRIIYNILAFATLMPLVVATHLQESVELFRWQGYWQLPRLLLLAAAFFLFWDGSRHYRMDVFLGITQVREKRQNVSLAGDGSFSQQGSLGLCRHPWYLGALLLLWTALPGYHLATVLAAAVLSLYLVVGAMFEERRLLSEYGEKYRVYQQAVSMLIPMKWMRGCLKKRNSMN